MHGIIFAELEKYVQSKLGKGAWEKLLTASGLGFKMYLPLREYPDTEAVALVVAASKITGIEIPVILEDFGHFIAPDLLGMYRSVLKPEWKTLEVLEHTEEMIHKVVRIDKPGAKPPELRVKRLGPHEVHLTYNSARKMCPLAKGIIRGLGTHFAEKIAFDETACMHRGDPACEMSVKRTA